MKLKTHKTTSKRIKGMKARKTGEPMQLIATTTAAAHLRHNKSKRQLAAAKRYQNLASGMSKRLRSLVPYL